MTHTILKTVFLSPLAANGGALYMATAADATATTDAQPAPKAPTNRRPLT